MIADAKYESSLRKIYEHNDGLSEEQDVEYIDILEAGKILSIVFDVGYLDVVKDYIRIRANDVTI